MSAKLILLTTVLLFGGTVVAQIPVEVFTGLKKSTIDVMFFKYFNTKEDNASRLLFFNRNRAGVDYNMTYTNNLPQFGFTEAVSYNHEKLKGFAPVLVAQIFNSGIYSKAGVQLARIKPQVTIFTWLVCETKQKPFIDFFFLGRYTPRITERLNLFSQLELVNAMPTAGDRNFSFTQRLRLGLKLKTFQFGIGADFLQTGRTDLKKTINMGGFIRYEF